MRHIVSFFISILGFVYTSSMCGQSLILSANNGETIYTELIDSITYSQSNGIFYQNLWRDGNVISSLDIQNEIEYKPELNHIEYEELIYDIDGVDAIITHDGLYAFLGKIPNGEDFVFANGLLGDDNSTERMIIDGQGFLKFIELNDGEIAQIFYSAKSLIVIDSTGKLIAEIPYSSLPSEMAETYSKHSVNSRATSLTRNRLYKILCLRNAVKDFIKQPLKTGGRALLRYFSEGYANRYGGAVNDFIDLLFDVSDVLSWIQIIERMEEMSYFGNANVVALDAKRGKVCTFNIPIEVSGLNEEPDFANALGPYEILSSYQYKLSVDVSENSGSENYSQSKKIQSNGIENFTFSFQKLSTWYTYEPSLTAEVDVIVNVDEESYNRAAMLAPGAPAWTPNPYHLFKYCTIYGEPKQLLTGGVSSSVEEARNIKNTSADIICRFSDIPEGASCQVLVFPVDYPYLQHTFDGTPGQNAQTITVSGLSPSTSYTAVSSIVYNGANYPGDKNISFTTTGPCGTVSDVVDITDKRAVAKCSFSNVSDGAVCGIFVVDENGIKTKFSASNIEGEQSIQISGLTPWTNYTCTAYVQTESSTYENDNTVSFTTDGPDITGTWNCTQKNWQSWTQTYVETTYTITLHEDGSVTHTSSMSSLDPISGGWSYSKAGVLSISIMDLATQTQNHGINWEFKTSTPKDPQEFEGSVYGWNFNNVIGYKQGDSSSCKLTR